MIAGLAEPRRTQQPKGAFPGRAAQLRRAILRGRGGGLLERGEHSRWRAEDTLCVSSEPA